MLSGFRIRKIVFAFGGVLVCLWVMWLAIPESWIAAYVQELLKDSKISIEFSGIKKGFFYTLRIGHVLVSRTTPGNATNAIPHPQTLICTIRDASIIPDVVSFLVLAPRFNISGQINGGDIRGAYTGSFQETAIQINGNNIQMNGLPVFENMGIYGHGVLSFHFQWKNDKGEMTFDIDHADLRGQAAGLNVMPLNVFNHMKGVLDFSDVTRLNPVSFEGKGIYLRLKGAIREQSLDGTMELMTDASFNQYPLLQATLKQYQVSPGYYLIPYHQIF